MVVATNASFAALQLVLLGLVIATYNIHFIILSILCGGLWWAINWFATELEASKQQEAQNKPARTASRPKRQEPPEESGTETEEAGSTAVNQAGIKDSMRLRAQQDDDKLKKRASFGDVSGTDSEWDKVSENEGNAP